MKNSRTELIRDLLLYKKQQKIIDKWVDLNFGYWGDAPAWANDALDISKGLYEKYIHAIDACYDGKVHLHQCDIPECNLPTWVVVGYDKYDYNYKIRAKCAKRGICYEF